MSYFSIPFDPITYTLHVFYKLMLMQNEIINKDKQNNFGLNKGLY